MVNALTEASPTVRADAARALAEMQGDDCALLLRLKARAGDAEAAVTGQVLEALLALERRAALPFVRQFLAAGDQVAEEAALALGGSRQSDAVDVLLEAWPDARGTEYRQALLRALSISRHDRRHRIPEGASGGGRGAQDAADASRGARVVPGEAWINRPGPHEIPARPLPLSGAGMVRGRVPRRHAAAAARLARHRARRIHADPRSHRHRQDARRLSLVHRPPDVRARPGAQRALPRALHLAHQSAGRRRRAQLRSPLVGIAQAARARGHRLPRADDRDPHRRHSARSSARASPAAPPTS